MSNDEQLVTLTVRVGLKAADRMEGEPYKDYLWRINSTARRYVTEALKGDNRLSVLGVTEAR